MPINEITGVPPYQKVIIIDDQEKDYTLEKHTPTLLAKHFNNEVLTKAEQEKLELEKKHTDLQASYIAMQSQLQQQQLLISAMAAKLGIDPSDPNKGKTTEIEAKETTTLSIESEVAPAKENNSKKSK